MEILWDEKEREAIKEMSKKLDISEAGVVRQALRMYQLIVMGGAHVIQNIDILDKKERTETHYLLPPDGEPENCPQCGTKQEEASGLGKYCPKGCKVDLGALMRGTAIKVNYRNPHAMDCDTHMMHTCNCGYEKREKARQEAGT